MYIEKYWGNYIGGSDDSMTLLEYLAQKQTEALSLAEIFSDSGLDKLGSMAQTDGELALPVEGMEAPIYSAISLIADLAAILLECRVNGSVSLAELSDMCDDAAVTLTADAAELELIDKALADFSADPLSYDISEMLSEEEAEELAAICEQLRNELFE